MGLRGGQKAGNLFFRHSFLLGVKTVASSSFTLLADIGATNARFALYDGTHISDVKKYLCADYPHLKDAIDIYHRDCGKTSKGGAISIACPVDGDRVDMTNHHWGFSVDGLKKQMGWDELKIVNDFYAVAASIPPFIKAANAGDETVLKDIKKGTRCLRSPIAVIGPGTGLGMALLTPDTDGVYHPYSCEGGHVTMHAHEQRDFDIFQEILKANPSYSHISAERLVSGKGLYNMYLAICKLRGSTPRFDDAAAVAHAGIHGECSKGVEAVERFCTYLGSVAGNQALTLGARGGVFIAGGIMAKWQGYDWQSRFVDAFLSKGRFRDYLTPVPVYLMTHEDPAFEGLKALIS